MNKENIKKLIFQVISDSGDDSTRDGLKGTPERVSKLYEELLSGYGKDINELVKDSLFKTTLDDMIVVKNIEFSIKKGDKTAIVGESGSGKTTLINFLMGLQFDKKVKLLIDNYKFSLDEDSCNIDNWHASICLLYTSDAADE